VSRNILCVVEFDSYPDEVVSRATWLAKLHDLDLHLLVSDPSTDFLGNTYVYLLEDFRPIADSIKEYQEEALGRLMDHVESAGVSVETSRSTDRHVADMIRREADARQPKYVLKGTHYHTPSERASMADADWDLIRDLEYPIWFVKPIRWREPPVIVAAVDPLHAHDKPAHLDKRIIKMGQDIAGKSSGDLQVLHTRSGLVSCGRSSRRNSR
jgi:universal stress protein E